MKKKYVSEIVLNHLMRIINKVRFTLEIYTT